MEALRIISDVVINNYKNNVHKMENIPYTGFDEADQGCFNIMGIIGHSGIVGDSDYLLLLDPEISQKLNDFDVCYQILYQLGKLTGKGFGSGYEALIDSDYYLKGQIMILQRHFSPVIWTGETILCSPNDKLIQYAVQYVNKERERNRILNLSKKI